MASGMVAAGIMLICSAAFADTPLAMAPPVRPDAPEMITLSGNASEDTVFAWNEVPTGERISISRAVFDQGGYQLYDTEGETIVVPFTGNNLYVMKFAESKSGDMYFVNKGDYPVLYVPRDGYLENATVPGARWYPFTQQFHPTEPVYLGVAPSWNDFTSMGWYPDMWCWGGYWSSVSFFDGGAFSPCSGFVILVGDNRFRGWSPYYNWCAFHPAPFRVGWYNPGFYGWATRPHRPVRFLGGGFDRDNDFDRDGDRDFDRGHRRRPSRPTSPTDRWDTMHTHRDFDGGRRGTGPQGINRVDRAPTSGWHTVRPGSDRFYTAAPGSAASPTHVWRHEQPTGPTVWRGTQRHETVIVTPPASRMPVQPNRVWHEEHSMGATGWRGTYTSPSIPNRAGYRAYTPPSSIGNTGWRGTYSPSQQMARPSPPPVIVHQQAPAGFQPVRPMISPQPIGGNFYRPSFGGGGRR